MNFIVTIIGITLSFETYVADSSKFGISANPQSSLEIALFTMPRGEEKRPGTLEIQSLVSKVSNF